MPNVRKENRKIMALWLDGDFRDSLDMGRRKMKPPMDRSTFIRHCIAEELKRVGISFNEEGIYAPDRAGKGGRPKKSKPILNSRFVKKE